MKEKCPYELAKEQAVREIQSEHDMLIFQYGMEYLGKKPLKEKEHFESEFKSYLLFMEKIGDYDSVKMQHPDNAFIIVKDKILKEAIKEYMAKGISKKERKLAKQEINSKIKKNLAEKIN